MSRSLHSSTVNLGGGRRSSSVGSNSSSRFRVSLKSVIGEMSRNVSASPFSRNHSKDSLWMAMRSGRDKASSRVANEYLSRMVGKEDNDMLLTRLITRGRPRLLDSLRSTTSESESAHHGSETLYAQMPAESNAEPKIQS